MRDPLLTVQDVARRLAVPVSWVYANAENGTLPSFKVGRYRRFSAEEMDSFLDAQRAQRPEALSVVGITKKLAGPTRGRARSGLTRDVRHVAARIASQ